MNVVWVSCAELARQSVEWRGYSDHVSPAGPYAPEVQGVPLHADAPAKRHADMMGGLYIKPSITIFDTKIIAPTHLNLTVSTHKKLKMLTHSIPAQPNMH